MAREGFKKEQEIFRLLFFTDGAYTRPLFAEKLGISIDNYDKTMRKIRDMFEAEGVSPGEELSRRIYSPYKYQYYEAMENMLRLFYRSKSLKEKEQAVLLLLLQFLRQKPRTRDELLDALFVDGYEIDEKTLTSHLHYLGEHSLVRKNSTIRPHRYELCPTLGDILTDDELHDLYAYIDFCAHTRLLSVPGYLLRDTIRRQLQYRADGGNRELFLYRYNYFGRILDEYQVYEIASAMERGQWLSILYYPRRLNRRYEAKRTGETGKKGRGGERVIVLPLRIVYDNQYGRWYLLGQEQERQAIRCFRIENIADFTVVGSVGLEQMSQGQEALDERLVTSWLVETGAPQTVRIRFYFEPAYDGAPNFVRQRVLQQGRSGRVIEESETTFLYEIEVNGIREMKPWIRSFGSSAEVLHPPELRGEMKQEWQEMSRLYESV